MTEEREHWLELREVHVEALRVLELQAAQFSKGLVPLHIATEIKWRREQIADLEAKLAAKADVDLDGEPYRTARMRYLDTVLADYGALQLRGLARREESPLDLRLEQVYVSLNLTPQARRAERFVHAEAETAEAEDGRTVELPDFLSDNPRAVFVGRAGSGKTTFLRFIAATLARAVLENDPCLALKELGLAEPLPLPVFVRLRHFNSYRKETKKRGRGPVQLLCDHVQERALSLHRNTLGEEFPDDFFRQHLQAGRCIVLFDGLDEVADNDERVTIRKAVEQFVGDNRANRFIITTRGAGYEGLAQFGEAFRRCQVGNMTPEQQAQLVRCWYGAVHEHNPDLAQHEADDLLGHMAGNERIRRLVDTPLMLTVLAIIHYNKGRLPEQRAELFDDCVRTLLTEPQREWGDEEERPEWLRDVGLVRENMAAIAFHLHSQGLEEVGEKDLVSILAEHLAAEGYDDAREARREARRFIAQVRDWGGLLEERDERFSFTLSGHRIFQEFLAGLHLVEGMTAENRKRFLAAAVREAVWHEPIRLAAGYLALGGSLDLRSFLNLLSGLEGDEARARGLALAAEALAEMTAEQREKKGRQQVLRVKEGIVALLAQDPPAASLAARVHAGNGLGRIGDPRLDPTRADYWCHIEGGPFWMGRDKPKAKYDDEVPRHQPRPELREFWIARYAVTNGEYARFLEAERQQSKERRPPDHWDGDTPPPDRLNHPVVYVSWHDAVAYCRWLTREMQEARGKGQEAGCKVQVWRDGKLETLNLEPGAFAVRLPTEAEWERSARGTDEREYPWGDEFDPGQANTTEGRESWGGSGTTPVGCYPDGDSPCGALDISGNVWEWCSSLYKEYPHDADDGRENLGADGSRVLRGGSWDFDRHYARCACRYSHVVPDARDYDIGFRVVVSPMA